MDSEEKYREYSKKINDIIEKYKTRLDELNKQRKKMFDKGMNYDSEEIQKSLMETRQIYMEQGKMFYTLLHDVTNYFNSKKNEENEILQKLQFLRNEIQFNYYQCFAERMKIENQTNFYNVGKIDKAIKEQYSKLENLVEKQKEYDKKILELMGIFLSIFSVIGLGVTGILNIQDNLPTNILLIMGSILIVVTLLFALIKYESENKYKFWILIIFGINLILTGIFFYNPVDKNWEEAKIKIENLEKKLDYEKRINELENKTK